MVEVVHHRVLYVRVYATTDFLRLAHEGLVFAFLGDKDEVHCMNPNVRKNHDVELTILIGYMRYRSCNGNLHILAVYPISSEVQRDG